MLASWVKLCLETDITIIKDRPAHLPFDVAFAIPCKVKCSNTLPALGLMMSKSVISIEAKAYTVSLSTVHDHNKGGGCLGCDYWC